MKLNNMINSPVTSSGWASFATTVTATTTAPTYGAGTTITSYYRQQGKILLITLSILAVQGSGSNGSGTYLFNLPLGFAMNTAIVSFPNSPFALGSATGYTQSTAVYGQGVALAFDSTHYYLFLISSSPKNALAVSSSYFTATSGGNLGANLQVPIV